jgi:hypothetical protein
MFDAPESLAIVGPSSASSAAMKPKSARTNGNRVFAIGGDGRGAWARRHRDIAELHLADIGGEAHASEAMASLCRRASTIEVSLEQMEARLSEGDEKVDLDLYNRLAGNLRRILESIGLKRVPRDVTLSLRDILAEHAAEDAA